MKKTTASIALFVALLTAPLASAHPGHGHDGGSNTLLHFLCEPIHIVAAVVLLCVLAAVAAACVRFRRVAGHRSNHGQS